MEFMLDFPASPAMSCAMRPMRVPMPVAVTTPRPFRRVGHWCHVGNPGCHKPTIWGSCTAHKNGHLGMVYSLGFPLPIAVDKPMPPLWFAQKKWVRKDNSVSSENVNLLCSN
jgi:hypothetical protein